MQSCRQTTTMEKGKKRLHRKHCGFEIKKGLKGGFYSSQWKKKYSFCAMEKEEGTIP